MENDFQKDKIDDVFSDLDNKEDVSHGAKMNYESEMIQGDLIVEKQEDAKKSNVGFFVILGIIIVFGALAIFLILK